MKVAVMALCLIMLAFSAAGAGKVYGVIKAGGTPVGEGVRVEAVTTDTVPNFVLTDRTGTYRLYIRGTGKFTLKVTYQNQSPTFDVYVYDHPVRYNFVLERVGDRYILRRE